MKRLLLPVLLVAALPAYAKEPAHRPGFVDEYMKNIDDEIAGLYIQEALGNIVQVECGDAPCVQATESEFRKPPITLQDSRWAASRGGVSAMAEWCGIDPGRSFILVLAYGKYERKMNERQMQLLSLIHSAFKARQGTSLMQQGDCPAEVRERLEQELPVLEKKRPV